MKLEKKRFTEIQCPICKEQFKKSEKGRTLKQWEISLSDHLMASSKHSLPPEEAKSVIAKYFKSLEGKL
jgi:hypothetical protein